MTVDYRTALLAFLMIVATCVVAQNPESEYSFCLCCVDFVGFHTTHRIPRLVIFCQLSTTRYLIMKSVSIISIITIKVCSMLFQNQPCILLLDYINFPAWGYFVCIISNFYIAVTYLIWKLQTLAVVFDKINEESIEVKFLFCLCFLYIYMYVCTIIIDKRVEIPCVAVRGAPPPSTHFLEVIAGDYISKKSQIL